MPLAMDEPYLRNEGQVINQINKKKYLKNMGEALTIGVITSTDPRDKRSWSGTHYRMINSLERQGFIVIPFGPVVMDKYLDFILKITLKCFSLFHFLIFRKRYNKQHSRLVSFFHGRFFRKKIEKNKVDVIFTPASSPQIAYLRTNIPICYYSDATLAILFEYYDYFSGFSKLSKREGNEIEQRAISNSTTQVFSSKWALDSAVRDYKASKAFIVKMGANIESDPPKEVIYKNYDSTFEILFIGMSWKRKGGDIVYETFKKLDSKGYDVTLTVIGVVPPETHPKMKVIPSLNKNIENDRFIFEKVLVKSHVLFLPTRADCTPIVFCEANAYGLPVISTDTGGVSSVIEDDVNGYLLPLEATSEDYFKVIERLIMDKEKLTRLAKTSREKYDAELNWNSWGMKMKDILQLTMDLSSRGKD